MQTMCAVPSFETPRKRAAPQDEVSRAATPPQPSANSPGTGNPRRRPASAAAPFPRRTSIRLTGCTKIPCHNGNRRGGARPGPKFL